MKKKVGVIAGGYSSEASISLESADTVIEQLSSDHYDIYKILIHKDSWECLHDNKAYSINRDDFTVTIGDQTIAFDCVFNAIHGEPGEGGEIQKYFKAIRMPFTASGHIASFNSFSKSKAKDILREADVLMPSMITILKDQIDRLNTLTEGITYPCIVKPNSSGSSYGVSKVNTSSELLQAVITASEYNELILIEQFVTGIELSCGVIEYNNKIQALPVTEIVFEGEIFDYELKYADDGAEEITPARISAIATEKCQRISEKVFKQLDLKDMARVDFILQDKDVYFIECNTIPGLSKNSILPQQLKSAGIAMKDFFSEMVERSACRD